MKRLGKGLGAILADVEAGYLKDLPEEGLNQIEIEKIKPNPFQPRKEFDEKSIEELATSIDRYGLLQPIVVIKDSGNYILVAGERRLRAVKKLGKKDIKAIVLDIDLNELREFALIENIQRENLNPIEIAKSLKSLIEEHNYTHEELAKIISKSRSYVTNLLRLLSLPEYVQEKVKNNEISVGHAKIMANLDENEIKHVISEINNKKLNVRETENLINKIKNKKENKEIIPEVTVLSEKLKNLGLKVEIGNKYIKILWKNEKDREKLKKLIDLIS
ncbi:chromosome partitioning protein, ParB family [Lebetimonas natsushimae]|uniref:Chromosome partitioning protein, ParB family n=1 Tax=Lebetimonas natsushimae TaxID=1936991 RepID=A0A292YF00_9BACT|nr:ParB/RepB/Spo0J family partition protein [Lebetimonas natsushimae]GAX87809.1 chromosome partitioning protein, ParB family [Lebetimonas natsushimae]